MRLAAFALPARTSKARKADADLVKARLCISPRNSIIGNLVLMVVNVGVADIVGSVSSHIFAKNCTCKCGIQREDAHLL